MGEGLAAAIKAEDDGGAGGAGDEGANKGGVPASDRDAVDGSKDVQSVDAAAAVRWAVLPSSGRAWAINSYHVAFLRNIWECGKNETE